jgi:UDP-N-acetylglucosamine transferase subunit ALG13
LIFISLGSREYQFNRLLKELDKLVDENKIEDTIIGQIGQSTYTPRNFKFYRFMSPDDFKAHQEDANLIISHGGTGALIGALKLNKQLIAVPRLSKYGEHIDDHQIEVATVLDDEGYLKCITDIEDLHSSIVKLKTTPITKKYDKPSIVTKLVKDFINCN